MHFVLYPEKKIGILSTYSRLTTADESVLLSCDQLFSSKMSRTDLMSLG